MNPASEFSHPARSGSRLRAAAALAGAWLAAASPAAGQVLTGRILTADSAAVVGALVVLADSTGAERARMISTGSGGFVLAPGEAGRYEVRVLRIGYERWTSPPVSLAPGATVVRHFVVTDRPVTLPDLNVTVASRCGVRPGDADLLGRLMEETRKALALTEATAQRRGLWFRLESWNRRWQPGRDTTTRTDTTTVTGTWPVQSAPPESLALWSFVHQPPERPGQAESSGPVYYAPDPRVLFSDWFLDRHCFSVETEGVAVVSIAFAPAALRPRGEIGGTLTLDRRTLRLRRLEFTYRGLPAWVPDQGAGGSLSFEALPSGAWVIASWSLRAPVPLLSPSLRDTTLFGWMESGGRLMEIRDRRGRVIEVVPRSSERSDRTGPPDGPAGSGIQVAMTGATTRWNGTKFLIGDSYGRDPYRFLDNRAPQCPLCWTAPGPDP